MSYSRDYSGNIYVDPDGIYPSIEQAQQHKLKGGVKAIDFLIIDNEPQYARFFAPSIRLEYIQQRTRIFDLEIDPADTYRILRAVVEFYTDTDVIVKYPKLYPLFFDDPDHYDVYKLIETGKVEALYCVLEYIDEPEIYTSYFVSWLYANKYTREGFEIVKSLCTDSEMDEVVSGLLFYGRVSPLPPLFQLGLLTREKIEQYCIEFVSSDMIEFLKRIGSDTFVEQNLITIFKDGDSICYQTMVKHYRHLITSDNALKIILALNPRELNDFFSIVLHGQLLLLTLLVQNINFFRYDRRFGIKRTYDLFTRASLPLEAIEGILLNHSEGNPRNKNYWSELRSIDLD